MREIIHNYTNFTNWKIILNDFETYYNEQIEDISKSELKLFSKRVKLNISIKK
jgi:hypothetical protein